MYPTKPHEEDIDTTNYRVKQLIDMGFSEDEALFQVKSFIRSWRLSPTPTSKWLTDTTESNKTHNKPQSRPQAETQPTQAKSPSVQSETKL